MTKLSKNITGKIQKEHIAQDPHWKFVLKHGTFWAIFGLSVLLGAAAFSVLLFVILELDFEIFEHMPHLRIQSLLSNISLFWILCFGVFFTLAYYGIRHTKKGYRFPLWKLIFLNLLASIVLGGAAYGFGGAEQFEKMGRRFPGYRGFDAHQIQIWSQPQNGLLGGTVIKMEEDKIIILEDFSKKAWEVILPEIPSSSGGIIQEGEGKKLIGKKIKIIGSQTGEDVLEAQYVLPWRRHRASFRNQRGQVPEENLMRMLKMHQEGRKKAE